MPDSDPKLNATFVEVTDRDQAAGGDQADNSSETASSTRRTAAPPRRPRQQRTSEWVSSLALEAVQPDQGGNYTCAPSNARPVSVRLHLIDGESWQ